MLYCGYIKSYNTEVAIQPTCNKSNQKLRKAKSIAVDVMPEFSVDLEPHGTNQEMHAAEGI